MNSKIFVISIIFLITSCAPPNIVSFEPPPTHPTNTHYSSSDRNRNIDTQSIQDA